MYRITLREDAAEDLLQDLFLRLSRGPTLSTAADPVGYAVRTVTRLAFDWRRSQRRRRDAAAIVAEPPASEHSAAQQLDQREDLQTVLDAIERLPQRLRDVIVMRYLESRDYDEIARTIGKSVHHARALCHRALVQLRRATGASAGHPKVLRHES